MPTLVERALHEVTPYRRRIAVGCAVSAVWAVWASGPGWSTPALVVAALAGVALGVIDGASHRLPNALTYPATAVVAVLLAAAAAGDGSWDAALRALLGALALGCGYLLLHLISPSGLGLGDVKLAVLLGLVGAWYGWSTLWATALLPFVLGGLVATALIVARRATRKTAIAFGPFMLVGAALALTAARLTAP
ncbi:A24 family peptidase [Isoptericola halotolerans]|uniref:Leader peptidase (Prepilin peptidase)/N-methyltransferase n=1 Tax=Isoptericola halotolerans TaxID=300560 RepID=A0ABX2A2R2_9MICO|nr:leader peptidase (prepilin peptidase)/N-methyltransferase [Isoptericola halotolerans]